MFELPSYFNAFKRIMGPEMSSLLVRLENAFAAINYDTHMEELEMLFMEETSFGAAETAASVYSIYRVAIDRVCSEQGIQLTDPYYHPLLKLVDIVHAISLLGTQPLSELLEGYEPMEDVEDIEYVCDVIGFLLECPHAEIMLYIGEVNSGVVEILHREEQDEIVILRPKPTEVLERLKKVRAESPVRNGMVVEYIQQTDNIGYEPKAIYDTLFDQFDEIKGDVSRYIEELRILVAGSRLFYQEAIDEFVSDCIESTYESIADIQAAYTQLNRSPIYG